MSEEGFVLLQGELGPGGNPLPPDVAHNASANTPLSDLNAQGLRLGGVSGSSEISVSNSILD